MCPGTTSPATTLNEASNRRYLRLRRNLGNVLNMAFSRFVKKLWREKSQQANKYVLTATSYGADAATFRQKFRRQDLFWFFQSLTAGYKLPGIVRQRATGLSAVQLVQSFFAFVVFRILSVTCSLTRALSQSHAHAQQLFSASDAHVRPCLAKY